MQLPLSIGSRLHGGGPKLGRRRVASVVVATWALSAACLALPAAGPGPAGTVRMRIVGGLAGVNQFTHHEEPFWTRELPALTRGKVSAEIVAFDRAGIRGQDMLRLLQLGVVPFGTAIVSLSAAQDPLIGAPDLAGLNPDMATLRKTVAAFRPQLEASLRRQSGIELLAIYVYPAQVVFCTKPLASLADLAKRRVRISGVTQADWVEALGATPVSTPFAELMPAMRNGLLDCAVTGTMTGNTIGLFEVTSHLHAMPITWGVQLFAANAAAWNGLPADVRVVLKRELPKLEQAIWAESERETGDGIACNVGAESCQAGRKGRMTEVKSSPADEQRRRDLLTNTVLPRWVQRCGPHCADVWNRTIGPVVGIQATGR